MSAKGSPWFKCHSGLPTHPKTLDLCDELDLDLATGLGHLVQLWCSITQHAPDGDLAGKSVRQIERMAGWSGPRGVFLEALVRVRFFDRDGDDHAAHNWLEYAGAYKRAKAEADRRAREKAERGARVTHDGDTVPHSVASVVPQSAHGGASVVRRGEERSGEEKRGEERPDLVELRQPQGPTTGINAVMGRWPGDEPEQRPLIPDADVRELPPPVPTDPVSEQVSQVWCHLRTLNPDARQKPGRDQHRKIRARLRDGDTVAELRQALTGYYGSDWHQRTQKLELPYIFKNREMVEKGIGLARKAEGPRLNEKTRRTLDAGQRWLARKAAEREQQD
jgi:hypothetical protein